MFRGPCGWPFFVSSFAYIEGVSFGCGPQEYLIIHHLLYAEGSLVSDAIPVKYTSFDWSIQMVRQCGPEVDLANCNIKSAFHLLPVCPADFNLLRFIFEGKYYVDQALPIGCSVSCGAFKKFSSFLEWALKDLCSCKVMVHYLGYFLFAGSEATGQCAQFLKALIELTEELGVLLEKTEGPSLRLTFLGIQIDIIAQTSRLSDAKLVELSA